MFRQPDDQKNLSEQVKGLVEQPTGGTAGLQAAPPSAGGQVAPSAPVPSEGLTSGLQVETPSAGGQVAPAAYTAPGGLTPGLQVGTPSAGGQVAPAAPASASGLTPALNAAALPSATPAPVTGPTPSATTSLPSAAPPPGDRWVATRLRAAHSYGGALSWPTSGSTSQPPTSLNPRRIDPQFRQRHTEWCTVHGGR